MQAKNLHSENGLMVKKKNKNKTQLLGSSIWQKSFLEYIYSIIHSNQTLEMGQNAENLLVVMT